MKRVVILTGLLFFVINSCGALKSSSRAKDQNEKSYNLPPDVNSNKYSKSGIKKHLEIQATHDREGFSLHQ